MVSSPVTTPPATLRWMWTRARTINLIACLALLVGFGLAFGQVNAYEAGITRQQFSISGVPVLHLMPATRQGRAIAVIVHGYSGSKDLMVGFGIELAKMGVPSYLLDLPGHGESPAALDVSDQNHELAQLEGALDAVVQYARAHSDVSQPQIVLLGHSLGTEVVGDYALHQPVSALAATILISPILHATSSTTTPANLLVIVGQNDIAGLLDIGQHLFLSACGGGSLTQYRAHDPLSSSICGQATNGTGRRLVVAPVVNHITILTDATTYQQVDDWVGATSGIPTLPVQSNTRVGWLVIGIICAMLALFPLAALVGPTPNPPGAVSPRLETETPPGYNGTEDIPHADGSGSGTSPGAGDDVLQVTPKTARRGFHSEPGGFNPRLAAPRTLPSARSSFARLGIMAAGVASTVLFLRGWSLAADALGWSGVRTPLTWMHMALADYAASFALVLCLTLLGLTRLALGRIPWPPWRAVLPQAGLAVLIVLVAYVTIGTLATYGWERFLLDGPRLLRGVVLLLVNLPLFALLEGLAAPEAQRGPWRGVGMRLGIFALFCLGYIGAIVADHSLFFLSLLVPIEGLLFIFFAALAQQMTRAGRAWALASAGCMAAIFAWAVAAVFPIVQ